MSNEIYHSNDTQLRQQITRALQNLQAQLDALSIPEINNQLLSGTVTWISGLTFQVSDCVFIINGTIYTSDAELVTLDAADVTHPRIDVFAANIDGTADVVEGTAAADPVKPEIDPNTQVEISFALVAAGATTPSGVTNENVYQENIEWTSAVSGATVSAANAASPYAGTLAIRFNAAANGAFITLTDSASNGPLAFAQFAFRIKNISYGTSNNVRMRFALYATGTRVSNWIELRHNTYGFDGTITSAYQLIQVPMANFSLGGNSFNRVRFEVAANGSNTLSFYLDDVYFQTSPAVPLTGVVYTTTNQTIADIKTFTSDPVIPDEAYGVGWNGVLEPPTKNAVYDKIETIGGALVSDTAYDATSWDSVTTIAPSKNAVRDKIEVMVAEADYDANTILKADSDNTPTALTVAEQTLVGRITGGVIDDLSATQVRALINVLQRSAYLPGMMYFATGYYSRGSITVAGNKITAVVRFRVGAAAATNDQRLITVFDGTTRFSLTVLENDHATSSAREKLQMLVQNSGGTSVAVITSLSVVTGDFFTAFVDYDGDAGTASMIINGDDEKDTGSPLHVLTTGTLETGNMTIHVGASAVPDKYASALIGSIGYKDAGGLDWTDFMSGDGGPKQIDESTAWDSWGGQPGIWNSNGQLERNRGTFGDFLKNGTILVSNENFDLATGWDSPVTGTFTPVIWDDTLSNGESQTYTSQFGAYRKFGDMVHFWLDVTINSLGTLTGGQQVKIGGLPFTAANPGFNFGINITTGASLAIAAGVTPSGAVVANTNYIACGQWTAATGVTQLTITELSTGGRLQASGFYYV